MVSFSLELVMYKQGDECKTQGTLPSFRHTWRSGTHEELGTEERVFSRECSSDLEPAESTVFTAGRALVTDSCQFRSLGRDREGDGP